MMAYILCSLELRDATASSSLERKIWDSLPSWLHFSWHKKREKYSLYPFFPKSCSSYTLVTALRTLSSFDFNFFLPRLRSRFNTHCIFGHYMYYSRNFWCRARFIASGKRSANSKVRSNYLFMCISFFIWNSLLFYFFSYLLFYTSLFASALYSSLFDFALPLIFLYRLCMLEWGREVMTYTKVSSRKSYTHFFLHNVYILIYYKFAFFYWKMMPKH